MANYPDVLQVYGTQKEPVDDTVVDRSESGKPRLRSHFVGDEFGFTVIHEVSTTDRDAIIGHWTAHRYVPFDFVLKEDGSFYTVRYVGRPMDVPIPGGLWKVTTKLVKV